ASPGQVPGPADLGELGSGAAFSRTTNRPPARGAHPAAVTAGSVDADELIQEDATVVSDSPFDIEVDKENAELTDAPTQIFFSADEIAQLTKDTPAPPDRDGPDTERPVVRLGEAGPVAPVARLGEAGPTHVPPSRQSVR